MAEATGRSGFQLAGDTSINYERFIGVLLGGSAELLVQIASPAPGQRVIDLACGTGFVARRLLPHVSPDGAVGAVDVNGAMLAVGRAFSPLGIEWHEADLASLPFPDGTIDLALCQHGLQFVPTPGGALREIRRVLAPGGRLLATVWPPPEQNPYYAAMTAAFKEHLDEEANQTWLIGFRLGDPSTLRSLADESGFKTVAVSELVVPTRIPHFQRFLQRHMTATPWVSAFDALSSDTRRRFLELAWEELAAHADGEDAVIPFVHLLLDAR